MEWASAIAWSDHGYIARIQNEAGVGAAPLKALVSRGLPKERRSRIVIETELRDWREADPLEYFRAFKIDCVAPLAGQAVYETHCDRHRVLVPALALMRAFFRPTQYLLPMMFSPQALDRVRYLDFSHSPPRPEFLTRTWKNLGARYGDVTTPISWMSAFPSAADFAASVHLNARAGRIAVTLPSAKARIALQGLRTDGAFMTTYAAVLELSTTEAPLEFASSHPKMIYQRFVATRSGSSPILRYPEIPLHQDGTVDLTDDEWRAIQMILFPSDKRRRATRLDARLIFDGILRKLSLGTPWRTTAYRVGTYTNALFAYRSWRLDGTLEPALSALVEQRRCATGTK